MIDVNYQLKFIDLKDKLDIFWTLSGEKIVDIESKYPTQNGSPVITQAGKYTSRGWTEWTQGFQYGSAILQYDATGDAVFLDIGRKNTLEKMATHISHVGVHDHGFNNVSTYGNLLRLMQEGKISTDHWEKSFYELALKTSGAVQATRWAKIKNSGYIYSFNGPHSLFVDTIRSCRSLVLSHLLGHFLQAENDQKIDLLERACQHIETTAKYAVFYGEKRDFYDLRGRTAHESIFNINDGQYRCPNSQQGYTGFSTWTRGLAWAICGFSEQLELFDQLPDHNFENKNRLLDICLKAAKATCDFYIEYSPSDGIPYWDTGAPSLYKMGNYLDRKAEPFNAFEPVDSTAAAIAAQGFLRLGNYLLQKNKEDAQKYIQAGITISEALLTEPYLSIDKNHQGLLLHSIYHRPNDWDYTPKGSQIPYGESSMWGDYHIRELALYIKKQMDSDYYYTFFNCLGGDYLKK